MTSQQRPFAESGRPTKRLPATMWGLVWGAPVFVLIGLWWPVERDQYFKCGTVFRPRHYSGTLNNYEIESLCQRARESTLGWTIGISLAIVVVITSIVGKERRFERDKADRATRAPRTSADSQSAADVNPFRQSEVEPSARNECAKCGCEDSITTSAGERRCRDCFSPWPVVEPGFCQSCYGDTRWDEEQTAYVCDSCGAMWAADDEWDD